MHPAPGLAHRECHLIHGRPCKCGCKVRVPQLSPVDCRRKGLGSVPWTAALEHGRPLTRPTAQTGREKYFAQFIYFRSGSPNEITFAPDTRVIYSLPITL